MNRQAVKEEIAKIIAATQDRLHHARQHAPSKKYLAQLDELGIADLMPAKFGNTDVQAVIAAATDSGKVTSGFDHYGEGFADKHQPSTLFKLLNEVEASHTVTAELDETFEIDGIEFSVRLSGNSIAVDMDGGFTQDDDGDWSEASNDFTVTYIDIDDNNIDIDGEFEVTITAEELRKAKAYRAEYPVALPE